MPGIREPRRGHRVCKVAGAQTADRSAVSSRRIWNTRRRAGAHISVGRGSTERVQGKFRFQIVGSLAGGRASSGSERFWRARSCRERVGVDADGGRAVSGVHAHAILSKLFRKLFRRQALRDEGWLATHRSVHAAALVPKLVPTALSVRLRNVPLRRGLIKPNPGRLHGNACTVTIAPARVCICGGRAGEPHHTWTERASFKVFVRRSRLGAVRDDLRLAGVWTHARGCAAAGKVCGRNCPAAALAGSGGGARERLGKKDAVDSGSALTTAKDVLLPHRDFAFGAGSVRKGTRTDRPRQRGRP